MLLCSCELSARDPAVLGAAAVYAEEVIYTTSVTGVTSRPPATENYAGRTFITRQSVDYLFEPLRLVREKMATPGAP